MPKWRSAIIIAVAWSTLSVIACWWEPQEKYAVKPQGGDSVKEGSLGPSDKDNEAQEPPGGGFQGVIQPMQIPFLNPDPFHYWHGVENMAKVKIKGESCMALLDNGMQINTIMPDHVKNHSLDMGLTTDLIGTRVAWMGLGNAYTWPLGYVIVWVQVDGVQGYDEDQIALVVPDELKFGKWICYFGNPHYKLHHKCYEEREIDALAMPWANGRVVHLLSVCRAVATVVDDKTAESANPNGYDEVVIMRNMEAIDTFSSCVIPIKVEKAYIGEHINVMIQARQTKDGSLPQGLTNQNAYTGLRKGSKNAVMVIRNSMAYPQTLQKQVLVARAVATIALPEPLPETRVWEGEDGPWNPHIPNLTVRQRQGKLFKELDLSKLDLWPLELADTACQLLAEYHDIFSESAGLGCTHSTEHTIKVTDDTPFKEWFRWIPVPLEALESLVGAGHFSCPDLKLGFWQIKMEEVSQQYTTFTVGNLRVFKCDCMPSGLCNAPAMFQRPDAKLSQHVKPHSLTHLPRWHNHILADGRGTSPQTACGLQPV